jgi:hypothetical protein
MGESRDLLGLIVKIETGFEKWRVEDHCSEWRRAHDDCNGCVYDLPCAKYASIGRAYTLALREDIDPNTAVQRILRIGEARTKEDVLSCDGEEEV